MNTPAAAAFSAFEAESRALGDDVVLVREWPALTVLDTHTHPFAARALVVAGEMWRSQAGHTRHLRRGA